MRSRSKPLSLQTVSEFGGIDILVANAGVLWLGPIESTPLKRWQLCMNVNLTGVFLVTKAVIPHVRARGGGSLIAITTTGVGMIDHGANAYWVSKAGAERLYLGLAADLRPDNIAVNCLSPSRVVLTEGWQAGGGGWRFRRRWSNRQKPWPMPLCFLAQQDASGITGTIQRSESLWLSSNHADDYVTTFGLSLLVRRNWAPPRRRPSQPSVARAIV